MADDPHWIFFKNEVFNFKQIISFVQLAMSPKQINTADNYLQYTNFTKYVW